MSCVCCMMVVHVDILSGFDGRIVFGHLIDVRGIHDALSAAAAHPARRWSPWTGRAAMQK